MGFSKEDFERVIDATISNKKFYHRLLECGLDINDVWHKLLTRSEPRGDIRLDDFYRDDQGMLAPTVVRWLEKYYPQKFENVQNTINALSAACQSVILTEREKYEIEMIKERVCKKYELYRDQDVRRKYREVKGKSPKTQAQCDTEALLPLSTDIWKIAERINVIGLDAEGRAECYYKKDVEELLACLLQAHGLAQLWGFYTCMSKDRDKAFRKALKTWKTWKNIPIDAKYVHTRVYPP